MTGGALWLLQVGASSPMAVLAGGIVAMYASGALGVPAAFLLVGIAVSLLMVGYVAMSRHVPHAAPGYAMLAHGLGPRWGLVGGALALVSYTAIQTSLYGLFGATVATLAGGSWKWWAFAAWLIVGTAGVLNVVLSTWIVAVVLIAELAMIGTFILAAFTHPADGSITLAPWSIAAIWTSGLGGLVAFGVAALIGIDIGAAYGEEAKTNHSVRSATIGALLALPAFYALSAWAVPVAVGADRVIDVAQDPDAGLPFTILDGAYGGGLSLFATMLLVTSVLIALLSFHSTISRHVFAMARERVLPHGLSLVGTGARAGAPIGGSLLQSVTAALVVGGFMLADADPLGVLFTWLSAGAALGLMSLLVLVSIAAVVFFRRGRGRAESIWVRGIGPVLGTIAGTAIVIVSATNQSSLLGITPGTPMAYLLPGAVLLTIAAGLLWASRLRRSQPETYRGIGHGRPNPLTHPEPRLADLHV
ncbi:APC family permease [Plantactinospora sp. S1510]|uniref:APC family permease n=1 Tax=Plantactinospora alkalitolerans TaxID=2789879 RepID=A0ABS0H2Q0_9ACTN|nr:APC family permease [Plantactinospora alkalitolerans]MBF9132730.1 APC family permease [Plantactinospora alkalitolerans]